MDRLLNKIDLNRKEFDFFPPKEAPVFRPKLCEFDDPISYIRKIRPLAEDFGMCRIIPPASWRPPFSVDIGKFTFNPRVQPLKELEATTRIKLMYLQDLETFWELSGNPLQIPVLNGKIVDLYLMVKLVGDLSSFTSIGPAQKWTGITKAMGFEEIPASTLKEIYERILEPFETFKGVRYKIRSLTKRNSTNGTKSHAKIYTTPDCKTFSRNLVCYWRHRGVSLQWPLIDNKTLDLYALHLMVQEQKKLHNHIDWDALLSQLKLEGQRSLAQVKENYYRTVVPFLQQDESQASGLYEVSKYCEKCGRGHFSENDALLTCDTCLNSFHMTCVKPVIASKPKIKWNCFACIKDRMFNPKEPYGFSQSVNDYTLKEFGEMAVSFKEDHFGMPALDVPTSVVEKEYWRLLSNYADDIAVEYGADIMSQDHGMGFPTTKNNSDEDEYAESKWNLNNIPVIGSSAYSHMGTSIHGVTIPWMYIGMCFSTFCWHIEDHWSYSINYLHWGEPKTWYSVPSREAVRFENALKKAAPELFEGQPDLLHDLSTILNPNKLSNVGVSVYRTDQRAGEFVVTFPRAYHAGFNQGFNFAEAVNFAPADWLPIGRACIDHYASLKHINVFSHDELVVKMAQKIPDLDEELAKATLNDMITMLTSESALRKKVTKTGICKTSRTIFENIPDDARQCHNCKTTCFLSAVFCPCKEKYFCLKHFKMLDSFCTCTPSQRIFKYRFDMEELFSLVRDLHAHTIAIRQ